MPNTLEPTDITAILRQSARLGEIAQAAATDLATHLRAEWTDSLCPAIPPTDPHRARAEQMAQSLTDRGYPSHVVCVDGGHYYVLSDPPNEPPPPWPDPDPGEWRALARTRADVQIETTMQTNRLCPTCQGAHWGWQCPAIHARLNAPDVAPWHDAALGHELCRMKWRNFRAFVALLLSVPAEHLIIYAASYQAFIREHRSDSDLTITQILTAWANDMRRGGDHGPALERTAA